MRKVTASIEEVKQRIDSLIGEPVKVRVNKGRKRIVKYDGRIESVYPSVFVLKITGDDTISTLSCSYSDVICGDIVISPRDKRPAVKA